jgi:hypothetical protein
MNNVNIFGIKNVNKARINLAAFNELAKIGIKMRNIPSKLNNGLANRNQASCATIPHMETVPRYGRQVVIGRQRVLTQNGYYKCIKFIGSVITGKQGFNWSMVLNDILIYYASTMVRQNFPIRLVDLPKNGNNATQILPSTVTHREIQQIKKFFGLYMYKSLSNPGIYFFSHRPNVKYRNIVRVS